jgi:hypothetical protein
MRNAFRSGVFLLTCTLGTATAEADPIVVTTTSLVTSGWFDCRGLTTCTGEGTDAITIGNGDATATVTFRGTSRPAMGSSSRRIPPTRSSRSCGSG